MEKEVGDEVFASTIVLAGRIGIRTAKTGEETVAMQIGKILEQTSEFKNSLQSQGEVIADRLAPFTLGLSALFLPLFGYAGAMTVLTNQFGYKMRLFCSGQEHGAVTNNGKNDNGNGNTPLNPLSRGELRPELPS